MAGRPLHRNRRNPLVSWDRQYAGTVGSGDYYYGPMLKADAEEKFRASMAASDRVLLHNGLLPLPLSFIVREAPSRDQSDAWRAGAEYAAQVAAKTKSVALLEYVYSRTTVRASKPGDPSRETPHTLFNALHRLCEFITLTPSEGDALPRVSASNAQSGDISTLPCMTPEVNHNFRVASDLMLQAAGYLQDVLSKNKKHPLLGDIGSNYPREAMRALLCSGFNTASGRLGAVDDADQALAEAFAKFCLSNDSIYDYKAPLMMEGRPVDLSGGQMAEIQNIREIWGAILHMTVQSVCRVFSLFVGGYYDGRVRPIWLVQSARVLEHNSLEYEILSRMLPRQFRDEYDRPVKFMIPKPFADSQHAQNLLDAVGVHLQGPSREEEFTANRFLRQTAEEFLTLEGVNTLVKGEGGKVRLIEFLRQKYAKPRNTSQSLMKAKRVMAAIAVLESRDRPRPGLHATFIQPNE